MEKQEFSTENTADKIETSLGQLEDLRNAELENAQNLLLQKQQHLIKEKDRLTAKYGAQYPEIQRINLRIQLEEERTKAVTTEINRSKIPTEPFAVASWRVNGLVLNENGKTLEGITVYLVDERQQRPEGLQSTCSDGQGYFAITLDGDVVSKMKDKQLFLAAYSKDIRKPIIAPEPLLARPGIIEYRDIFFTKDSCSDDLPQNVENNSIK
jgi:hypothetical protein